MLSFFNVMGKVLKVNCPVHRQVLLLLFSFESFLKKALLLLEQIYSFKSRPQFQWAKPSKGADRKSHKLFPLVNMAEKRGGVHSHLRYIETL